MLFLNQLLWVDQKQKLVVMIHLHDHKRRNFFSMHLLLWFRSWKLPTWKKNKTCFLEKITDSLWVHSPKNPSPSDVRRKFTQHFKIKGRKKKSFHIKQIFRVYEQFKNNGSVHRLSQTILFEKKKPRSTRKSETIFRSKTEILPFAKARDKLICQR